jgi:hypothetical protein
MPDSASRQAPGGWAPLLWLTAIAFALLFGGFLLWDQQSQRGALEAEFSSYRTNDVGCKALYLTLRNLGYHTDRLQTDYAALLASGLLFVIAPPETRRAGESGEILPYEIKNLDEWVRRGNTVVVVSSRRNALYEALGLFPSTMRAPSAAPSQPGRLTDGVKELALTDSRALRFGREPEAKNPWQIEAQVPEPPAITAIPPQEWVTLIGAPSDPVVAFAARGRGQYVAVADAHVASNLGLARGDNLRFLANLASLAGDGTVIFDEAHHRELGRGFMAYARARRMTPLLLAMVLLAALALWRGSLRFGDPVPLLSDEHRDSAEYVRAVAALYKSADLGRDAVAAAYEQFRRRTATAFGLGRSWNAEAVASRIELRTGHPAADLRAAISEVEFALRQTHLATEEAFRLASRLGRLEQEVAASSRARTRPAPTNVTQHFP